MVFYFSLVKILWNYKTILVLLMPFIWKDDRFFVLVVPLFNIYFFTLTCTNHHHHCSFEQASMLQNAHAEKLTSWQYFTMTTLWQDDSDALVTLVSHPLSLLLERLLTQKKSSKFHHHHPCKITPSRSNSKSWFWWLHHIGENKQ